MKTTFLLLIVLSVISCSSTKNAATSALAGKYWRLVEVNGQPLTTTQSQREPFVVFSALDSRLSGNSSCNNFFGNYTLGSGNAVNIGAIGATKMACPDMSIEQQLFSVLPRVKFYATDDRQLVLKGADQAVLARFEWDEKR